MGSAGQQEIFLRDRARKRIEDGKNEKNVNAPTLLSQLRVNYLALI